MFDDNELWDTWEIQRACEKWLAKQPHLFVVPESAPWQRWGPQSVHSYASGVYFLYLDDALQYVGLATSFDHRFAGHWRKGLVKFNRVAYIPTRIEAAPMLEAYYIAELDPPMNVKFDCNMDAMAKKLYRALKRKRPKHPQKCFEYDPATGIMTRVA